MTDPLTLTKLIVLYMLSQVEFPLTRAQVFDYILEKEYTNFFTLQQAVFELIDTGLVDSKTTDSTTILSINNAGEDTLRYFKGRLSDGIKSDITSYCKTNEIKLHNEMSIQADYYRISSGEYVAQLTASEKGSELVHIKLTMPSEDAAISICDNWKKNNQTIYAYLIENLM